MIYAFKCYLDVEWHRNFLLGVLGVSVKVGWIMELKGLCFIFCDKALKAAPGTLVWHCQELIMACYTTCDIMWLWCHMTLPVMLQGMICGDTWHTVVSHDTSYDITWHYLWCHIKQPIVSHDTTCSAMWHYMWCHVTLPVVPSDTTCGCHMALHVTLTGVLISMIGQNLLS